MDLALDTLTGDLLIEGGNLKLFDGIDAIAQHVAIRLQFFRGEWFLDQRIGIPYFTDVLVKNPDLGVVRFLLRAAVASTPGVKSLEDFSLAFDGVARTMRVAFTAKTTDDERLEFTRELVLA